MTEDKGTNILKPDSGWQTTRFGLLVPGDGAASSPAVQSELKYVRIQAWGASVAALVAVVALILSTVALIFQKSANDLAKEAKQQEYSSRVAWWVQEDSLKVQNRSLVPIRQVSFTYSVDREDTSIPAVDSGWRKLVISSATGRYSRGSLQPCSIVTFPLSGSTNTTIDGFVAPSYSDKEKTTSENSDSPKGWLIFTDANGTWIMASGGSPVMIDPDQAAQLAQRMTDPDGDGAIESRRAPDPTVTDASDCGS